jgi:hypothetical protein
MRQHNQLWWLVTKGHSETLVLADCAEVFPQAWRPINATMEPNWPTSPWP